MKNARRFCPSALTNVRPRVANLRTTGARWQTGQSMIRSRGFLLIEMLVAFAFLAVAIGFVVRLVNSGRQLDHASHQQLASQMLVDSLAERLSIHRFEELPEAIVQLEREVQTQRPDANVRIIADPFVSDQRSGLHVTISGSAGLNEGNAKAHLWCLESVQ